MGLKEHEVVCVTPEDVIISYEDKLYAHQKGLLHRAVSVFVFNSAGQMLIHQRAAHKYHSADLWTNASCSHPYKDESYQQAAERRLLEEMGLDLALKPVFSFIYQANFDNGLIEHELDHVFVGHTDQQPKLNPEEVQAFQWVDWEELRSDVAAQPHKYTPWFKIILDTYRDKLFV